MDDIKKKIQDGELIPFLGMGVFKDTKNSDGTQLPFDSDSMILSLNNGRAMSDRLMYEYSRAAMSLEQIIYMFRVCTKKQLGFMCES